jgi:hypothetical protein
VTQDPGTFVLLTPEGKGIIGSLDPQGVLTFAVEAGQQSSIRGTELFDRMIDHFGASVRAVHGVWRRAPLGRPSINIDKVNELTASGVPLEEAIASSWTVTRARRRGFSRVCVLGQPVGQPGTYVAIDVLIER